MELKKIYIIALKGKFLKILVNFMILMFTSKI